MSKILKRFKIRVVIRRYEVILISSVMLLSGAVMPSSWEPPFRSYPVPHVEPPPTHPWIALTFDDGPHPRTEALLSVLREAHVPATFFVVGKMADRYPQIIRDIARDGHELANHTYTHRNLSRLPSDEVIDELEQTREVVQRLTGQDAYLFRPPGGDFSRRTVRLATQSGYRMVLWNVLTDDVEGASPRHIRRRILQGAQDGAIILMHSGIQNTIDILPGVIAELRQRGYNFVTVSALLGLPRTRPTPPSETPLVQTASDQQY